MNNKIDQYNKIVDLIGNVIKVTNPSNSQDEIDEALHIAHTVGDVLKATTNENNIYYEDDKSK